VITLASGGITLALGGIYTTVMITTVSSLGRKKQASILQTCTPGLGNSVCL